MALPTVAAAGRAGQDFTVAANEFDAWVLLNQQRGAHGARSVRLSSALTTISRAYAQRMARENFIDHVAPDGSTVVQRIQASRYPLPLWYGEALSGYGSDAGATVNALLNSPTHRAILLDDRFTDVGVGYSPEFTWSALDLHFRILDRHDHPGASLDRYSHRRDNANSDPATSDDGNADTIRSSVIPAKCETVGKVVLCCGRFGGLLIVVVLCSALLPTAASAGRAGQDFVVPSIEYDAFVLVNQRRAASGSLRLSRHLTQAAEAYAVELARGNYLSHTGRDGSTFVGRVEASGYALPYWVGENIGGGDTTAAAAINGFMLSPGHRATLLDARFTDVGIGYSPELVSSAGSRWVIDFASSRATVTPEAYSTPVPGATATPIPTSTPIPLPTASAHRFYLPSVAR